MRETDKFVFFWTADDVFSNFYYKQFYHKGLKVKWSEQAIMYRKAKLFGAHRVATSILKAHSPNRCKQIGRSREIPFVEDVWVEHRERIYKEVLMDKFRNKELKEMLLSTGNKELVEASPYDTIWGIGLRESDPRAEDKSQWRGQNLLGKVLMEVREELRRDEG